MKKFYTTLAIAALAATSAMAASPRIADAVSKNASFQSLTEEFKTVNRTQHESPVATRAITSVEDVCKVYSVPEWWYPLSGEAKVTDITVCIEPVEANMVTVDISAVSFVQPLIATVDVAASTITIKSDDNQGLYSHDQYGSLGLELRNLTLTPAEEGGYNVASEVTKSITGKIEADGSIDFGDTAMFWAWSGGGYQFGMGLFYFQPLKYFTFNENEWNKVGTAKYLDGFLNPCFKPEYQINEAVDVPLWVSKTTTGLCLLQNPYMQGAWGEFLGDGEGDGAKAGQMVFNISNPDCVTLDCLVFSGVYLDFGDETQSDIWDMYFFNNEGYQVMNGRSTASIVEEVEEAMDPFEETIADYLSVYDDENKVVHLRNGMFGSNTNPLAGYIWNGVEKTVGLTATITLPEDFSAVEEIVVDENVPAKYYNLQGMEVKTPEAGQLVIVKKGSKSYKTIVK